MLIAGVLKEYQWTIKWDNVILVALLVFLGNTFYF